MPLNIDWQQILLHVLNLALLVAGLYVLLYKPVKRFMDQRAESYRQMAESAREKEAQAEQLREDYRQRLAQADAEIRQRHEKAVSEAEQESQALLANAKAESEKILSVARENAAREEQRILQSAQSEIAKLSVEATRKLMDRPLAEVYDQFLNAAEGSDAHDQP